MRDETTTARLAAPADAAAIAEIYNQGIEERIATFETEPRSAEQMEAQLAEKGDAHPAVVVERDGKVVAWASAGPYRGRGAYAGAASACSARRFADAARLSHSQADDGCLRRFSTGSSRWYRTLRRGSASRRMNAVRSAQPTVGRARCP